MDIYHSKLLGENLMTTTLTKALERVEKLFTLAHYKAFDISTDYTKKVYGKNGVFYTLFHSFGGSLHMALTDHSKEKKRAHHHQLDKITLALTQQQALYPSPFKVLELGCGKGYNLLFLATKFPDLHFIGIDITPAYVGEAKEKVKSLPNVEILQMDMDDIPFDTDSFRIIYDIESACHSHQHEKLLEKTYELLEQKGQFIVFELFRNKDLEQQSPEEIKLLGYIELSVAIHQGIHHQDWLDLAKIKGFRLLQNHNLSDSTFYGLARFHKMAAPYFRFPLLAKVTNLIIPKELQMYAIAAYLFKYSMESGLQTYSEIILEK